MANVEQPCAFPLAPPASNDIYSTLLTCVYALLYALFSGINAATFLVLIRHLLVYHRGQVLPIGITHLSENLRIYSAGVDNLRTHCLKIPST